MNKKLKPHHDLAKLKAKFATVDTLDISKKADSDAQALGFSNEDIVDVVQALEPGDFRKSETAHSPPIPGVWHDTYEIPYDGLDLYLKFAGATLIDVSLVSFKESSQ